MDNSIVEQIEALRLDCERQEVYYKTLISTHEVTIGQQAIQINDLKIDSANRQTTMDIERKKLINKHEQLTKAGEVVSDNVDTIVRLQAEAQEGWDLAESYNIKIEEYLEIIDEQVTEIKNLQMELKTSDAEMDSLLEQNEILYGSMESLELEVKDLGQVKNYLMDERDSLFNALIVLDPRYAPDSVPLDVQEEHTLTDDSLILQYTGVIEAGDNPFPGKTTPEPYPYTHPVRDVSDYSKVNRGLGMDVMVPAYMVK